MTGVYFRKIADTPEAGEVYLRVRGVHGRRALCDEMVLAEHEEDDRVYHNRVIPLEILKKGYHSIDENNPVVDLLYPIR